MTFLELHETDHFRLQVSLNAHLRSALDRLDVVPRPAAFERPLGGVLAGGLGDDDGQARAGYHEEAGSGAVGRGPRAVGRV